LITSLKSVASLIWAVLDFPKISATSG